MKFQAQKGMSDILPPESARWQYAEKRIAHFLTAYGCEEIRTPVLEQTDLFKRSMGEASDVVHKEMYTFEDRAGRSLTLRPEMTAGVVRAAIEHNLLRGGVRKPLYYLGPMFRAERPQAGRKRQFHQMGVEILNAALPADDIFLLCLADGLLKHLGVRDATIKINNLGNAEDRAHYAAALKSYFEPEAVKLCEDCRFRLTKNVLRILDCKAPGCRALIEHAPPMVLGETSRAHFAALTEALTKAGVAFVHDTRLVRGLDYYTGCVFEVTARGLGAQDALLAGGRYDGLIKDLGGPEAGACGFAMGLERLMALLETAGEGFDKMLGTQTIYVAPLESFRPGDAYGETLALRLGEKTPFRIFVGRAGRPLRDHLKSANELFARFLVIVGENERQQKKVSVKDLSRAVQEEVDEAGLVHYFLKHIE